MSTASRPRPHNRSSTVPGAFFPRDLNCNLSVAHRGPEIAPCFLARARTHTHTYTQAHRSRGPVSMSHFLVRATATIRAHQAASDEECTSARRSSDRSIRQFSVRYGELFARRQAHTRAQNWDGKAHHNADTVTRFLAPSQNNSISASQRPYYHHHQQQHQHRPPFRLRVF